MAPPDFDGEVDTDDVADFKACAQGAAIPLTTACEIVDFDGDGDGDMNDFARLQRCYSGPANPATADCAE